MLALAHGSKMLAQLLMLAPARILKTPLTVHFPEISRQIRKRMERERTFPERFSRSLPVWRV